MAIATTVVAFVALFVKLADSVRESDGETVHAQLKFKALLEPQT